MLCIPRKSACKSSFVLSLHQSLPLPGWFVVIYALMPDSAMCKSIYGCIPSNSLVHTYRQSQYFGTLGCTRLQTVVLGHAHAFVT